MRLSWVVWTAVLIFANRAFALDLGHIPRPIDDFENPAISGATTLKDHFKEAGFFALGGALTVIGRSDLTGVSLNASALASQDLQGSPTASESYDQFERPVGGDNYEQGVGTASGYEQAIGFTSQHSLFTQFQRYTARSSVQSNRINRVSIRQ